MKSEILLAFNELLEERQLPRQAIVQAIEAAMVHAYRKAVSASGAQRVEARLDLERGQIKIFVEKEVVESVQDARTEVALEEARRIKPDVKVGEMIMVDSTPADFGRVAAQTARQVIQQRLRDAERNMQLEYYKGQIGEIVSGVVQAVQPQQITVGLDMKAEGILPANHKIPGEKFRVHDRIRAVVVEVKETPRGPQIILSRTHRQFLKRLLENEVPEIYRGIVEIKSIAREPGQRAKVAVAATQPGIDPVGACVGIKGVRIQAIVKELHDEKIDVIQWDPDPVVYISKALSPARVLGVYLSESVHPEDRAATVVVSEDQLSLAIGRDGQNARLAARLTGWRIDIKSLPEAASEALYKLQQDPVLQSMLPLAVETMPQVEEILAKKAENRPVTPEEYQVLARFVDWIERRIITAREETQRVENERIQAARAEIPEMAFSMPLERLGLKEHIYNILSESFETVGELMLVYKTDPDRILKMPGIGPRAMENIQVCLAALPFTSSAPAHAEAEVTAEVAPPPQAPEIVTGAEAPLTPEGEKEQPEPVVAAPQETPQTASPVLSEEEDFAKDGVRLDELFSVELFRKRAATFEMDEEGQKSKKKKAKRIVELDYDEESGETIARRRRKRDEEEWDW